MRALLRNIVMAACLVPAATAKYICDKDSLKGLYPFCINIPDKIPQDNKAGRLPTILYLGGSGTVGDRSNIEALTSVDGVGKLLKNYRSGNMSEVNTFAAQRFITIIPVAPPVSPANPGRPDKHYRPEYLDRVLALASATYPVDLDRIYFVGYSMGCRGSLRNAVFRPTLPVAVVAVACGAEKPGGPYLVQDPAPATFPELYRIASLPVKIFAGTHDETAGVDLPRATYNELVARGSTKATFTLLQNTHDGLQTEPFTLSLLQWLIQQRRASTKAAVTQRQAEAKGKGKKVKAHRRSFPLYLATEQKKV